MVDTVVSQDQSSTAAREVEAASPWLLLTHHLPPEPAYFRVKVRRRLITIGAVPLKNSVYALPSNEECLEDFQWLAQEIRHGGGEVTLCRATFLDRTTDEELAARFREARDVDYREISESAGALADALGTPRQAGEATHATGLSRLKRRLMQVTAIDYFDAPEGPAARDAVASVAAQIEGAGGPGTGQVEGASAPGTGPSEVGRGRTWVTRAGIREDRMASAWLIEKFIDPDARFRFVAPEDPHVDGEIRFDMFEGEYTHVGDDCTFETLLSAFGLEEPALVAIGEIVHDIDIKDDKFGRPEVIDVAAAITALVKEEPDDRERLAAARSLLDDLLEHFRTIA